MGNDSQNIYNNLIDFFEDEYFWFQDLSKSSNNLFYSDSVKNVTGYTSDELVALPGKGKEYIVDEDLRELKNKITEFKNNTNNNWISFDFRIERKDKEIVWLRETIKVERDKKGEITKYFGRVYNISDYVKLKQVLKDENEELKKINAAKDSFIGMLSHDLRAPFTSILGFSEILLSETNLSENEKEEYLTYINDSSQNQLQLINDLLDWSRLQTGKLKIEKERVNAQSLVFNGVSSLTGNTIRKGIDIKVNVPENLFINVDEKLVLQVITNLLANAIKFSPEKSTVEISANIFNDKFSEFIVRDEGIGISEEGKEKLFKIGRMFSTDGTKGEKGTGLGLSLAKQIVEKHNGGIWFYSTVGEGSEFHFTVPSYANTILVIHNDHSRLETYNNFLNETFPAYKLLSATNGYEALGMIISHMPLLIISVHEMPLMNGVQLVQTLRKEDNPITIPVIALLNEETEKINESYEKYGIKTIGDNIEELKTIIGEYNSILK
ncbi:ATP-binding protein [Bacteroidota bacterium]